MRLSDRTAIVTGAGSGIGRAVAIGLAANGARVAAVDQDAESAHRSAADIAAAGGSAMAFAADVSRRDEVERMRDAVLACWPRVHVLVCAAGIDDGGHFLDLDDRRWQRVLAVNLGGLFVCGQTIARHMAEAGGGSIVNVTSQLADVAQPAQANYLASKGGAKMLTKAMALDLARHGIRVNALAPGLTRTAMTALDTEQGLALNREHLARIPLGRAGEPEDMVGAAVFLASDESAYVTGISLVVDGGYQVL